jgi:hypothetical protein
MLRALQNTHLLCVGRTLKFVNVELGGMQDRQPTNNVTLRRVRVTTVAVESNKYYVF